VSLASKISSGEIQDMDDIAAELTNAFRSQGETDVLIGWKPAATGYGGNFLVTGPWAGSNATIYLPLPPLTGATGSGDMTMGGRPFEAVLGFSVITAGTSPGPGDATATRVPITTRWTKTSPPNQPEYQPDPAKMPVLLRRTAFTGDGTTAATFELEQVDWDVRLSGDELTNKAPRLFKNEHTIRDVQFHEQRIFFAGGPYILGTATGDLFRFFKEEDVNLVDSDPVEIEIGETSVPTVYRLTSLQRTLIATTNTGVVYELFADGPWTPTSIGVTPGPRYNLLDVQPLVMDNRMYLACARAHGPTREPITQVIEYDYDDFRAKNSGFDVTAHVPTLLNTQAVKLAGAVGDGPCIMVQTTATFRGYLYQTFFANGSQRQQSAWSTLTFGEEDIIADIETENEGIVLLMVTGEEDILIETMRWNRDFNDFILAQLSSDYPWPYMPNMDRMQIVQGALVGDSTHFTLSYDDTGTYGVVMQGGRPVAVNRGGTNLYVTPGDRVSTPEGPDVIIGKVFTSEAVLSRQYLRDNANIPVTSGDINILSVHIDSHRFGPYDVIVTRSALGNSSTVRASEPNVWIIEDAVVPIHSIGPSASSEIRIRFFDQRPMNIRTIQVYGERMDSFSKVLRA
jgi:hypothetical protein